MRNAGLVCCVGLMWLCGVATGPRGCSCQSLCWCKGRALALLVWAWGSWGEMEPGQLPQSPEAVLVLSAALLHWAPLWLSQKGNTRGLEWANQPESLLCRSKHHLPLGLLAKEMEARCSSVGREIALFLGAFGWCAAVPGTPALFTGHRGMWGKCTRYEELLEPFGQTLPCRKSYNSVLNASISWLKQHINAVKLIMLCNISLLLYQIYFKVKLSLGAIEQQAGHEGQSWGPCWCCHGVTMLHSEKLNAFPALKLKPQEFFLVLWTPGVFFFFTKHQSRGYTMFAFKVGMLRTCSVSAGVLRGPRPAPAHAALCTCAHRTGQCCPAQRLVCSFPGHFHFYIAV